MKCFNLLTSSAGVLLVVTNTMTHAWSPSILVPTTRRLSHSYAPPLKQQQQQQQQSSIRQWRRLQATFPQEETPTSSTSNTTTTSTEAIETTTTTNETTLVNGTETPSPSNLLWRGVVVGLCAVWASNFAVAKLVMAEPGVDSSLYALSRFGLAAVALAVPSLVQAARDLPSKIDGATARGAAACGGWVAFGYLGQTVGLLTTTASRSCVICTMHCVFVAIVAEALRVSRAQKALVSSASTEFNLARLAPAALAVAGVALVELKGAGGAPNIGDALSFAQPVGFGLGYLQLEELMRSRPQAALPVSAIKLAVVALASFCFYELSPWLLPTASVTDTTAEVAAAALTFPRVPDFGPILSSPVALGGILYTGLVTTAAALWIESIAFKRVPATDASIILTTEPLFAAAAGAAYLGETFGSSDYIGATMIIGACALAVLMDEEEADDQCSVEDAQDGKCELPRTIPISAE